MSKLRLNGASSGYVEIQAPDTASNNTITLPSDTGSIIVQSTTGITSFANAPVVIGSGTSTGTASQTLQVTGGAYVSGSLGVGIINPAQKLTVGDGTSTGVNYIRVHAAKSDALIGQSGGSAFGMGASTGTIFGSDAAFPMAVGTFQSQDLLFGTNNIERARIDSSGRLLVGTSSARANFENATIAPQVQVEGLGFDTASISITRDLITSTPGQGGGIQLARSGASSLGSNALVAAGNGLGFITFNGADGTEFVPAANIRAEVDGTPGANDMPGRLVFSTTADGSSSPTERVRIDNGGNTMLGGGGPGTQGSLTVQPNFSNGTGTFIAATPLLYWNRLSSTSVGTACLFQNTGITVGSITYTNTATTYATSSDYRLKENVVPLTDAVDRLKQLQVHRFNFIADPDTTVDGFIAHEAQAVVPECVTGTKDEVDADGNPVYQGIDQSKLVPLLTAALQEALQKIQDLESRISALESN